jgi:alpha-beta hydrolase superfamily lysophospholipase
MIRSRDGVYGISTAMCPIAMPDLETTLQRSGLDFHVEHFFAKSAKYMAVVMVHGFAAHCGLYRHVGVALAARGIAVTQFDCRGHGRSGGRRGHIDDFADYIEDLAMVVKWARERDENLPWALLGHSMGSAIALTFAMDTDRAEKPGNLILVAPWLKLKMKVSAPKRMAGKLAPHLCPTLTIPNGLKAEDISRNPEVHANFYKDLLVHHIASAGWFMNVLRAQAYIRTHAQDLRTPTLMLLAGEDRIVVNDVNLTFASNARAKVDIRCYPPLFHEIYLEPEAEAVLSEISTWLLDRLKYSKTA